jgi:hypothetical protein
LTSYFRATVQNTARNLPGPVATDDGIPISRTVDDTPLDIRRANVGIIVDALGRGHLTSFFTTMQRHDATIFSRLSKIVGCAALRHTLYVVCFIVAVVQGSGMRVAAGGAGSAGAGSAEGVQGIKDWHSPLTACPGLKEALEALGDELGSVCTYEQLFTNIHHVSGQPWGPSTLFGPPVNLLASPSLRSASSPSTPWSPPVPPATTCIVRATLRPRPSRPSAARGG